jgi:dUTP pyrophosphatase
MDSIKKLLQTYSQVMHLKIYVNDNDNLKKMYLAAADNHNQTLSKPFLNAGFDLYAPGVQYEDNLEEGIQCVGPVQKVDFKIQCSAKMYTDNNKIYNTGYYMYPRSSLSKTKLRLANSVGIIDSGYRGNIMGMFDVVNITDEYEDNNCDYFINIYDRLVQICAPSLAPIYVEIIDNVEHLGEQTERGTGGFGSTGR